MQGKHFKTDSVMTPVIQYITGLVMKSGTESFRLPGELELAEQFGISRVSVRRALAALIARKIVIQHPKKRGYYSNPMLTHHKATQIGILSGFAVHPVFPQMSLAVLSGFSDVVAPLGCSFNFFSFPASMENPDEIYGYVRTQLVDALLWISPYDENIPAINALIDSGFPVVAVGNPYIPNMRFPQSNYLHYDFTWAGTFRGREVLERGFTRPLYLCEHEKATSAFIRFLKENGISVTQDRIVITPGEIPDSVKRFLDAGDVDVIISDGKERYRLLFDTLSAHPEGHKVAVLVENEFFSREIVPFYPQLNFDFFKKLDIHAACRRAGNRAGKLLMQKIKNRKKLIFDSEVFS